MTELILFIILGLGGGAIYAALALGIVIEYRGSGNLNLAYGALATYPAFAFAALVNTGDLVLPIGRIDLGASVSMWLAFPLALMTGIGIGLLIHYLVFTPMRHAPPLGRVVASVGVMISLQAIVILRFGSAAQLAPKVLPAETMVIFGANVPRDRLYLAALVVVVTVLLTLAFRYFRFGVATRAAAENQKGAVLLGYSTNGLALTNALIGATLAGVFGILVTPITGLDAQKLTLLIVPALAASLVGRFTSLPVAAAAGLGLGILQSTILMLEGKLSWLPRPGLPEAVPFVVIIIAMYAVGNNIPGRLTLAQDRMPAAPAAKHRIMVGVPAVGVGVILSLVLTGPFLGSYVTSLIYAVVCMSLVVLTGLGGQISLAQMVIAGAAAFSLSKFQVSLDIPFPIAPILAIGVAAALGVAVGIPALRVRGLNLAVVTLALSLAVTQVVFTNPKYTGGADGSPVPAIRMFGIEFLGGEAAFAILCVVLLAAAGFVVSNLRRSRSGLAMLAVRANERAASSLGINVRMTKVSAFAISSALAGLGGVMLAYNQRNVSFQSFGAIVSLTVLASAYLGGITMVSGALIGGSMIAGGLTNYSMQRAFHFGQYQLLISGLLLVLTAVLNPDGISGATLKNFTNLWSRRGRQSRSRARTSAPELATVAGEADR